MPDWESIVRTFGPRAFETAWRLLGNTADTEDVVQEALLNAFELYGERKIENWGGLLRHLATRRAIDRLRKRRETATLHTEPVSRDREGPEEAAVERELAERLRRALAELPDREARVFSMRYFSEMTNSEIAETLSLTTNAVGVALHKARVRLKELLDVGQSAPAGLSSSRPAEVGECHE